jgi:hypothetical protein
MALMAWTGRTTVAATFIGNTEPGNGATAAESSAALQEFTGPTKIGDTRRLRSAITDAQAV